jgi:hypothetical protein
VIITADKIILSRSQQIRLDLITMARERVFQRKESPMIKRRTFGTASGTVADNKDSFFIGPRTPILIYAFEPSGEASPRLAVISGSASHNAPPMTIDVTDYAEIKAPAQTAKRTNPFPRSAVGSLIVFAAAAALAATLSVLPAADRPALVSGPLSGHSILHFPR